jgi:hypothetical protein
MLAHPWRERGKEPSKPHTFPSNLQTSVISASITPETMPAAPGTNKDLYILFLGAPGVGKYHLVYQVIAHTSLTYFTDTPHKAYRTKLHRRPILRSNTTSRMPPIYQVLRRTNNKHLGRQSLVPTLERRALLQALRSFCSCI